MVERTRKKLSDVGKKSKKNWNITEITMKFRMAGHGWGDAWRRGGERKFRT